MFVWSAAGLLRCSEVFRHTLACNRSPSALEFGFGLSAQRPADTTYFYFYSLFSGSPEGCGACHQPKRTGIFPPSWLYLVLDDMK